MLINTAIVNDFDSAISLSLKYPEFRFVTKDGDLVEGSGCIESGSPSKADETLFGKKQLLSELKKELANRNRSGQLKAYRPPFYQR